MSRIIKCVVVKRESEGLDHPPHPGELGIRIFENVSKEGWVLWLERLITIINENGLNTADPRSLQVIEQHMLGFFFQEGNLGGLPAGYSAGGRK